jgi:radical SAM protein with 4Fe4S-binding SPASM domain
MLLKNAVHAVVMLDSSWQKRTPQEFETDWLRLLLDHRGIRQITLAGNVTPFASVAHHRKIRVADGVWDEAKLIAEAALEKKTQAVLRLRHSAPFRFPLSRRLLDAALEGYHEQAYGGYFQLDLHDLPYDGMIVEVLGKDAAAALASGKMVLNWLTANLAGYKGFPVAQSNLPLAARVDFLDNPRVEYYSFPRFIALEASRLCNLRCTMCALHSDFIDHSHTDGHPKHFRLDKYHWILEQMAPYKDHLWLAPQFWGEPFMSPYLKDMIRAARDKGMMLSFTTNGTLWDEDMIDYLIRQGVYAICVSMDGATKETFEQVRIGASFEKVVDNLHRLLKRKAELKSATPYLQINMALFPENRHEQEKLLADWMGKADFVSISNHCVNNVVPELHYRPDRIPCPTLWQAMQINTNGDVIACCRDSSYEEVMGNAYETPILEIWNNAKYRHFRAKHIKREWTDIPMCVRCDSWSCRSRRVERAGNLLVNTYPFYKHFLPVPAGIDAAAPAPAAVQPNLQLLDRAGDTGRAPERTLINIGTLNRKAS